MRNKKVPLADIETPGRTCWLCDHIRFYSGSPHYSELTPGTDMSLECGKRYWEFDNYDDTIEIARRKFATAECCADYEPCEAAKGKP